MIDWFETSTQQIFESLTGGPASSSIPRRPAIQASAGGIAGGIADPFVNKTVGLTGEVQGLRNLTDPGGKNPEYYLKGSAYDAESGRFVETRKDNTRFGNRIPSEVASRLFSGDGSFRGGREGGGPAGVEDLNRLLASQDQEARLRSQVGPAPGVPVSEDPPELDLDGLTQDGKLRDSEVTAAIGDSSPESDVEESSVGDSPGTTPEKVGKQSDAKPVSSKTNSEAAELHEMAENIIQHAKNETEADLKPMIEGVAKATSQELEEVEQTLEDFDSRISDLEST